ncbi:hypothetical protein WN51_12038 [Melipona quadrifasciata]|uniref:Uncharacterized protein n=1 Tax=Melipona quadrifasciata TaxID=166423 RepID=A0A0N0BH46_9HYME|nr:hypothetical protein WN51_12038 [Melipona quadrifasciata]
MGNANREREHGGYAVLLFDSVPPRSLWTGTMFSQQQLDRALQSFLRPDLAAFSGEFHPPCSLSGDYVLIIK